MFQVNLNNLELKQLNTQSKSQMKCSRLSSKWPITSE